MSLLDCTPHSYFLKAVDRRGAAQSRVNIDRNSDAWGIFIGDLLNLVTLVLEDR